MLKQRFCQEDERNQLRVHPDAILKCICTVMKNILIIFPFTFVKSSLLLILLCTFLCLYVIFSPKPNPGHPHIQRSFLPQKEKQCKMLKPQEKCEINLNWFFNVPKDINLWKNWKKLKFLSKLSPFCKIRVKKSTGDYSFTQPTSSVIAFWIVKVWWLFRIK